MRKAVVWPSHNRARAMASCAVLPDWKPHQTKMAEKVTAFLRRVRRDVRCEWRGNSHIPRHKVEYVHLRCAARRVDLSAPQISQRDGWKPTTPSPTSQSRVLGQRASHRQHGRIQRRGERKGERGKKQSSLIYMASFSTNFPFSSITASTRPQSLAPR